MLKEARYALGTAIGRPRRWRYLERLPKGGVGAEIGVFRGAFSPQIVRVTQPRVLHLIDCWWTCYGETFPNWGEMTEFGRLRTRDAYEEARRHVEGLPCQFHVGDDLEILPTFPDGYFDWVYLDSAHSYEQTLRELEILRHKTGLIVGDDWEDHPRHANHGESVAVKEFCARYGWQLGPIDPVFGQYTLTAPAAE